MKLSTADMIVLRTVAGNLGVAPAWLEGVINFETAGTWDPQIKNPLSSARGLIQFLDSTAVDLGYLSAFDLVAKHPTIQSQLLGPVTAYFKKHGPYRDQQDFEFSVFLPKYRRAPLDIVIYSEDPAKLQKFRAANPGIKTVGDYHSKLKRAFAKFHGTNPGEAAGALALAVLAGTAALFFLGR